MEQPKSKGNWKQRRSAKYQFKPESINLKEIATSCEISKELTFHIARHTFATTVTLANGVPIESVSKMLGHTDIKTTQHYAKILDLKLSQDMALLKIRFSNTYKMEKMLKAINQIALKE